jgi:Spy/CpxP family protein refolding chaperone
MNTFNRDSHRLTRRSATAALALLGLFATVSVWAAPAMSMPMEVNFLLGYVERSGCDFQRNGSWYTAQEAQAHLRDKFNYLAARSKLDTTEHFIERAATESSLTGRAYMVRCNGGPIISSKQWLSDELLRFRKTQ